MLCCAGLQEGEIGVARGVDVGVLRHVRRLGLVLEGRGGGGLVCYLSAVCGLLGWGGGLLVWSVMQLTGLLFCFYCMMSV